MARLIIGSCRQPAYSYPQASARLLAERIDNAIQDGDFGEVGRITASFGTAQPASNGPPVFDRRIFLW